MGDMSVAESVNTIVGSNTLIIKIVLVKSVGGQHKQIMVSLADILHFVIGQIVSPCTNLSV